MIHLGPRGLAILALVFLPLIAVPTIVIADDSAEPAAAPASDLGERFREAILDVELVKALALLQAGLRIPDGEELHVKALRLAVKSDNVALVKALVEAGLKIKLVDEEDFLGTAAASGFTEMVRTLLDLGVDPDAREAFSRKTALMLAAEKGRPEITRILLNAGAKVNAKDWQGETAIEKSAYFGHLEVVEILRAAGAKAGDVETRLLWAAARDGRLDLMKRLLESEVGPDSRRSEDSMTPLMESASEGHIAVVRELLSAGADVNFSMENNGYTALIYAVTNRHVEVANLLLEAGADITVHTYRDSILTLAAKKGLLGMVKRYLDEKERSGLDSRHLTAALGAACANGHAEIARALIAAGGNAKHRDRRSGWSILMHAARSGSVETVRALIEAGADLNKKDKTVGRTPAVHAAEAGDAEVFRLLEEAGAKVREVDRQLLFAGAAANGRLATVRSLLDGGGDVHSRDWIGLTAVMAAAREGHADVVEFLIAAGADVNEDINGTTALEYALARGHEEAVLVLIEAGAEVNITDSYDGETPLMEAADKRKLRVVVALLAAGADPRAKDDRGHTALDTARMREEPGIIVALKAALDAPSAGADVAKKAHAPDPAAGFVAPPASLDAITRLADQLESGEEPGELDVPFWKLPEEMEQASAQIAAYLEVHPRETRAVILAARLYIAKYEWDIAVGDLDPGSDTVTAGLAQQHEALDRLLEREPDNNAEAHYWNARLYGIQEPVEDDLLRYRPRNLDKAIEHAQLAVELAPARSDYREALGLYLYAADRFHDAVTVTRELADGGHPMHRLLADMEALELPESATYSPTGTRALISLQESRGRFVGIAYGPLRVRVYTMPDTASELEQFLAQRWPDVSLFRINREESEGMTQTHYVQFFDWREDGLNPTANMNQMPEDETSGLALTVVEVKNPTREILEKFDIKPVDTFCQIALMNFRPIAPHD